MTHWSFLTDHWPQSCFLREGILVGKVKLGQHWCMSNEKFISLVTFPKPLSSRQICIHWIDQLNDPYLGPNSLCCELSHQELGTTLFKRLVSAVVIFLRRYQINVSAKTRFLPRNDTFVCAPPFFLSLWRISENWHFSANLSALVEKCTKEVNHCILWHYSSSIP